MMNENKDNLIKMSDIPKYIDIPALNHFKGKLDAKFSLIKTSAADLEMSIRESSILYNSDTTYPKTKYFIEYILKNSKNIELKKESIALPFSPEIVSGNVDISSEKLKLNFKDGSSLDISLSSIFSKFKLLDSSLEELRNSVTENKNNLTILGNTLDDLKTKMEELKKSISSLDGRISNLEGNAMSFELINN